MTRTADPAFLLRPPHPDRLAGLSRYHGCDRGHPTVVVAPSQAICGWMHVNPDRHFKAWCAVIDMLLDELGARVILVPHVQEVAPWNDDRILVTELLRHFDFDPRIRIAGGDHSASELKGIIGQCDLVVAERMHAAIAALSSGICAVAIKYSIKAEGILRDVFARQETADALLLSLDDFLDPTTACARVRDAWRMKSVVEAELSAALPDVQRRAGLTFDLVAARMRETRRAE